MRVQDLISETEYRKIQDWLSKKGVKLNNLNQRFADGTELAKILKTIYPKKVDLHNYTRCSAYASKMSNWQTLNTRVLQKNNIRVTPHQIECCVRALPGAIEGLLLQILNHVEGNSAAANAARSNGLKKTTARATANPVPPEAKDTDAATPPAAAAAAVVPPSSPPAIKAPENVVKEPEEKKRARSDVEASALAVKNDLMEEQLVIAQLLREMNISE